MSPNMSGPGLLPRVPRMSNGAATSISSPRFPTSACSARDGSMGQVDTQRPIPLRLAVFGSDSRLCAAPDVCRMCHHTVVSISKADLLSNTRSDTGKGPKPSRPPRAKGRLGTLAVYVCARLLNCTMARFRPLFGASCTLEWEPSHGIHHAIRRNTSRHAHHPLNPF